MFEFSFWAKVQIYRVLLQNRIGFVIFEFIFWARVQIYRVLLQSRIDFVMLYCHFGPKSFGPTLAFIINAGKVVFICDVPPLIGLKDTSKTKCAPIWYLIFSKYERFSDYKSV